MDGQDAERIRDPQDDLDLRAMPQPSRSDGDFEVTTNASEDAKAVEAKLMQNGHPVAYESKKLNSHQVNYSIHDTKMCVIMNALERWQSFLLGKHFKIYTDHRSLVHFKTQSNLNQSPTTTLLLRVYKQTSSRHTELKCGTDLSFVCKGAWGHKMIIWVERIL